MSTSHLPPALQNTPAPAKVSPQNLKSGIKITTGNQKCLELTFIVVLHGKSMLCYRKKIWSEKNQTGNRYQYQLMLYSIFILQPFQIIAKKWHTNTMPYVLTSRKGRAFRIDLWPMATTKENRTFMPQCIVYSRRAQYM